MRRSPPLLLLGVLLALALPARAETRTGSVVLPMQPSIVRSLANQGVRTNVVGVVFPIPAWADGLPYTLTRTSGVGNVDVYFYAEGPGGSIGDVCYVNGGDNDLNPTTETGPICSGPRTVAFGIVVLRWGANAGFSFSY